MAGETKKTSGVARKYTKKAYNKARSRPVTAWAFFVKGEVKRGQPGGFKDQIKELSEKWRALTAEAKAPFIELYESSKKAHQEHKATMSDADKKVIRHYKKMRKSQHGGGSGRAAGRYALFVKAMALEMMKEFSGKTKFVDFSRAVAKKWKAMDESEKQEYSAKAPTKAKEEEVEEEEEEQEEGELTE